jgi:hypothetical protein
MMDRMDVEISTQVWILRITQAMSLGLGDDARDLLTQCLCVHSGSGRAHYLTAVELAEASDVGALIEHVEQRLSGLAAAATPASDYDAPDHFLVQACDSMSSP